MAAVRAEPDDLEARLRSFQLGAVDWLAGGAVLVALWLGWFQVVSVLGRGFSLQLMVELDAYPFEQFPGTVAAIGAVTVGQISANGHNGGAERIPVEISLASIDRPVWPGMRAAVNIEVRETGIGFGL